MQGVGGVMVSIVAFQAIDLGSIPGQRMQFLFPDNGRVGRTQELDWIFITNKVG